MEFSIGLSMIICALAVGVRFVRSGFGDFKRGNMGKGQIEQFDRRIGDMERRLTDIQEIVLAIDEKLERQSKAELG